ncbi:hypothetical protein V8F20_001189 [Naviculisporaceae sp. PSN 640]
MVRFTDSSVVDDYPPRQPSRNGRWSPDYHYAGGAAPPSPGGSVRGGAGGGPYMAGAFPAQNTQAPPRPVLSRENSLQVPHWDRYRPRSVPPPLSPTNDNSTIAFPPSRPRSRNHDRDYDRDRDRDRDRHEESRSRRRPNPERERESKGRHRERYYDSDSSSSDDDRKKRSRTPLSKARHALSSTFSDSTTGLGAGVIGAIVGGLAAREASENLLAKGDGHHRHGDHHSSGKEALLSTIAGAAVGALGANAIEKRIEASRNKKSSSSSSAAGASPTKGSDDGKSYTWGHERRRSSTIEDKRDRDRERETYKERDLRRDRSQRRGNKDEDRDRERERHRYHTSDDSEDESVYDYKRRKPQNRERDRSRPRRDDDWR